MESSQVAHSIKLGGSAATETALDYAGGGQGDAMSIAETVPLGQTELETSLIQGSHHFYGHFVASPIHTSSHYQTFETPHAYELVGGDRNMEQNNLVVTPDGKSWDEVTRDVSYIGNMSSVIDKTATYNNDAAGMVWDVFRGVGSGINLGTIHFTKDFAIAYNRLICLKTGQYHLHSHSHAQTTNCYLVWVVNGQKIAYGYANVDNTAIVCSTIHHLQRGDYVQLYGTYGEHDTGFNKIFISRI